MRIQASVSIVPIQVFLDLPDDTPIAEIRDRVIEQARSILANNGASHVILASSQPDLVDSIGYLSDLGFPVLTEYVPVEPESPDWSELAQVGITGTMDRHREDDEYHDGMPDWVD